MEFKKNRVVETGYKGIKIVLNISFQNKIFFIFIVVLFIGLGPIGWIGYKNSYDSYLQSATELNSQNTANVKLSTELKLATIPKDVSFLSENYALRKFMVWRPMSVEKQTQKWKIIFTDILKDFLETRENYYKVRVIGLDGREIVVAKYDVITDAVEIKKSSELQDKSMRNYVIETKKLKKGEFYVSDMNLNLENGKITKPFVPVVRYSTPIYNSNNTLIGIIVASIYAEDILKSLNSYADSTAKSIEYFLINKNGNYLYNREKNKLWGESLKHGFNFYKEYPKLKESFTKESDTFTMNGFLYSYEKIYPLKSIKNDYWYIISKVDTNIALVKLENFKVQFFSILFLVFLASFIVVRYYLNKIVVPLSKVTRQLKSLSMGIVDREEIEYKANDEVGEIVKSTTKLVNAIETTIIQANAVANGDFTKDIELLSRDDKLGLAIISMTKRLKEITNLAQKLSGGNYDTKIIAKSNEDKLGLALMDMVSYLESISQVAESIAKGEIDIDYKVVGEEDRLGIAMLKMIGYLRNVLNQANAITKGDFSYNIVAKSQKDELSIALSQMTDILKENSIKSQSEIYFNEGITAFSDKLTGIIDMEELSREAISTTCRYIGASSGVVYQYDKELQELKLISSFSFTLRDEILNRIKLGESVIGQVALEKKAILLRNIRDDAYEVSTGLTLSKPKEVYALPLLHEGELLGVIEYMSFEVFEKLQEEYLSKATSILATAFHATLQNDQIKILLEKSQVAFEELQVQSEELQESNVQMEEQQQQLSLQAKEMKIKNDELLKAKEALDKRAEDLEKASKYKSEFLANMSHELRTPLNSIILLSKLLTKNQNGTLGENEVAKTSVIHKAGNDLLLLINDILDLSKIESGNMELNFETIESFMIEDELKGLFLEVAKEKSLEFRIDDRFHSAFSSDKIKLLQILKNLLSNAFKFTKEGRVVLKIDKDDSSMIFEVQDSGIGIPKEKLALIFEAFKQVDGSISREYGGTGLGLSISKTFVDLMGGTIEVESKDGEGSLFRVLLPLRSDKRVSKVKIVPKDNDADLESLTIENEKKEPFFVEQNEIFEPELLKGKNILIVDDDSRNIFTLSSVLQELGAETFSTLNGLECIKLLEEEDEKIDVILMDIMMPVMDGLQAIKILKKDERFKHIPIIAVTAKTMKKDKEMCFEAGANDYLAKPIEQNALISMMKAWSK